MFKHCQVTKKQSSRGYSYVFRGIPKKKKGIGLKVTGKTRRVFEVNLQRKKLWFPDEKRFVSLCVSTKGLRCINKKGISSVVHSLRAQGHTV